MIADKKRISRSTQILYCLLLSAAFRSVFAVGQANDRLIDISPESAGALKVTGGMVSVVHSDGTWLRLAAAGDGKTEMVIAPKAAWDLSARESIHSTLHNPGREPVTVRVRAENADAKDLKNVCRSAVEVLPGEKREFVLRLTRRPDDPGYAIFKPFYMYSRDLNVRDNTIDPARVVRLVVAIDPAKKGEAIEIADIRAAGEGKAAPVPFFPFIDRYGQYMHGDWPGKIRGDSDYAERLREEISERAEWPKPKNWDAYGGWSDGPKLKATGFFYPAKHDRKWWLVDPEGRLFWSYGVTGVGFGGDTSPVTGRENWFADLPARDAPLGQFYGNGKGATYMFYKDRDWLGYDIQRANLLRKYGDDYENEVAGVSHDRLHSWGFNTIGNWSASQVYLLHRTPYTVAIHYGSALIHFHMPDVYDPGWEPSVRARLQKERATTANDPWNLGYFIDNERWFGTRPRAAAVAEETMKNPPERRAKIKFMETLKTKYSTIGALNDAWGTKHESWEALLAFREPPDMKNTNVLSDCGDFGMMFAERYFSVCRDAVKAVAPNNLYLGSRFFGHTDPEVVKLAAKYCDVISYNIYDNPPDGRVNQYNKLDVPVLSTEWGIESDPLQTPFRGANMSMQMPAERARLLTQYAEHAIRHPNMVGAHFFQYRDQPLSGRPDGEATLRGFVNVADTPNFELVQANRRVAYTLYETRAGTK